MKQFIVAVVILAGMSGAVAHADPADAQRLRHRIHQLVVDRNYWEDCYRNNTPNCN